MLQAHADEVLAALGRESAATGIFEADGLAEALNRWGRQSFEQSVGDGMQEDAPGIRQRAWPLVQLLRRAQEARVPVIWTST